MALQIKIILSWRKVRQKLRLVVLIRTLVGIILKLEMIWTPSLDKGLMNRNSIRYSNWMSQLVKNGNRALNAQVEHPT